MAPDVWYSRHKVQSKVTAVITTHGRPRHVREALASLRGEQYPHLECVIVEDLSSAEAAVRLTVFDESHGARVLRGHQLGVGRARNLGLAAAQGEFVIFLDDDDVAFPARISTLVETAGQFDADLCFGMTRRVAADGSGTFPAVPTDVLGYGAAGFCDLLACAPHINSVLARTAALRQVGGFDADADHFDDWSAWLRMADVGMRVACVGEVVAEWRIHGAGLSGLLTRAGAMKTRLLGLFDRLMSELADENAGALAIARRTVSAREIHTYDDYALAMKDVRDQLHATGECLGRRQVSHCQ